MAAAHRVDSYSPPLQPSPPVHNAQPLPRKMIGWEPLHLTFRHTALPDLPTIHNPTIAAAIRGKIYEASAGPSGHSVKSLAWMGDAVLYLASTKACLKAGLQGGKSRSQQLGYIRSGLTTNRTFSYLTLSYRIPEILGCSVQLLPCGQKRYADYFEAYVGAAWVSASETKDSEHIREVELFLSQLFKPKAWPALESLTHGTKDLVTTTNIKRDIGDDLSDDDDDVAVFDVPPARIHRAKPRYTKFTPRGPSKNIRQPHARTKKLAEIAQSHHHNALAHRAIAQRPVPGPSRGYVTPVKSRDASWGSHRKPVDERSIERRRQSIITNRVASRLSARSSLNQVHTTPVQSRTTVSTPRMVAASATKVFRLTGDNDEEIEIDMDLIEDTDWEDVKPIATPLGQSKVAAKQKERGRDGTMGSFLTPIIID